VKSADTETRRSVGGAAEAAGVGFTRPGNALRQPNISVQMTHKSDRSLKDQFSDRSCINDADGDDDDNLGEDPNRDFAPTAGAVKQRGGGGGLGAISQRSNLGSPLGMSKAVRNHAELTDSEGSDDDEDE